MCGIAAAIGIADASVFAKLFPVLAHRGPDESGTAEAGDIRIGIHRLAIVGRQGEDLPLASADGRWRLAFNGEIYNHRELRRTFSDYPWRCESDGEVILAALAREGSKGLARLRGMFAFVLVDMETGAYLAARDPFGIKPLYFAHIDGGIALASELKSFAAIPCRPQFLPPGHLVTAGRVRRWYQVPGRFWRPSHPPLRQLLESAVASHLPEEGPCGVFLSGGLDSSIVAALAARLRPDIVAYSVALPGSADEEPAAEVARHLGIRHKVLRVSKAEAQAAFAPAIAALESFNPVMVKNAIPLYLLSAFVDDGCKVVLGGDGSDELFAGYEYLGRLPRRRWQQALDHGINNLHRTELQRVDRMTMAHGIELRVPFLDLPLAEAALDLPLSRKIGKRDGRPTTKLALREAAVGLLPDSILWRDKLPLADGSGFSRLDIAVAAEQPRCVDGWGIDDDLARFFFGHWRRRFPEASPFLPIWSDAGRYNDFKGRHGQPLLQLFRG